MKKAILILTIGLFGAVAANAQTGSWYIGGNVGLGGTQKSTKVGSSSTDNGKTSNWSISPEIGTFLTDNVQLGLGLTVSGTKNDDQASTPRVTKGTRYGATLYSRYFFGKEAFKPFVGVNVSTLPGKDETTFGGTTTEVKTFSLGASVNAGFGFALSKNVTAVGSFGLLGFASETAKSGNTKNTTTSFGLDAGTLGNRFTVGVYFNL